MGRLDSRTKNKWRTHAHHACSAAFIHKYRVLSTYVVFFSILKIASEEEALVDVAKKGRLKPKKRRVINEDKAIVKVRKWNDEETEFDRFIAKCMPVEYFQKKYH